MGEFHNTEFAAAFAYTIKPFSPQTFCLCVGDIKPYQHFEMMGIMPRSVTIQKFPQAVTETLVWTDTQGLLLNSPLVTAQVVNNQQNLFKRT